MVNYDLWGDVGPELCLRTMSLNHSHDWKACRPGTDEHRENLVILNNVLAELLIYYSFSQGGYVSGFVCLFVSTITRILLARLS